MSKYKEDLDKMTWSYSRISSYSSCPYQFYKKYIEEENGINNFFAENGKLLHSIHEKILKGELSIEDCVNYYVEEFDFIDERERENVETNTLNACVDYLSVLDFAELDKYNILGIEEEIHTKIGKFKIRGFIDLLLEHKETGEIIVLDHKSGKYMLKKNGDVLKGKENDFLSYKHQLYLYCKYVIEKYGKTPRYLVWNHFKDGKICKIDFVQEEYDETLDWFKKLIKKVYKDTEFEAKKDYVMCNSLCDYRRICEYKNEE